MWKRERKFIWLNGLDGFEGVFENGLKWMDEIWGGRLYRVKRIG